MAKTEKKVSIALFDKIVKEHFQNEAPSSGTRPRCV